MCNKLIQIMLITLVIANITACKSTNWRTASREPAGIAPKPMVEKQAVIEFYAADARIPKSLQDAGFSGNLN